MTQRRSRSSKKRSNGIAVHAENGHKICWIMKNYWRGSHYGARESHKKPHLKHDLTKPLIKHINSVTLRLINQHPLSGVDFLLHVHLGLAPPLFQVLFLSCYFQLRPPIFYTVMIISYFKFIITTFHRSPLLCHSLHISKARNTNFSNPTLTSGSKCLV